MEKRLKNIIKLFLVITSFLLITFIGFFRYLSGVEYAISILFLIPVIYLCWNSGRIFGFLAAVYSIAAWLVADIFNIHQFSHFFVPVVNAALRFLVFWIVLNTVCILREKVQEQKIIATTDYLTKINNRRGFIEKAELELERFHRNGIPFTMIFFDVDDFKLINDRLGHDKGDLVLMEIADQLVKNIRTNDILGRMGGDEFVLLISETGIDEARTVIEKIRKIIINYHKQKGLDVTCSFGVVECGSEIRTIRELIMRADNAMYLAKNSGKNCIKYC